MGRRRVAASPSPAPQPGPRVARTGPPSQPEDAAPKSDAKGLRALTGSGSWRSPCRAFAPTVPPGLLAFPLTTRCPRLQPLRGLLHRALPHLLPPPNKLKGGKLHLLPDHTPSLTVSLMGTNLGAEATLSGRTWGALLAPGVELTWPSLPLNGDPPHPGPAQAKG